MDIQSEVIRNQMEETRTALQDKLETLEQQVKETVQNATEAVSETVSTVKEAVQDTVGSVKDSVHDTVESVKDTFDLRQQVERRPWTVFCGAALVGFFGARLLQRPHAASAPLITRPIRAVPAPAAYEEVSRSPSAPSRSWLDVLAQEYADELKTVKGLAISTLGGLVGEMVTNSAPPALKEQIKEVVDSLTTKLGGHPLEGSLLTPSPETPEHKRGSNGVCHDEEMTSSVSGRQQRDDVVDRFAR